MSTPNGVILPGTLVNTPLVGGQECSSCSSESGFAAEAVVQWSDLVENAGTPVCGDTLVVRVPDAGVSAIRVGETALSGEVEFTGPVSISNGKVLVTASGQGSSSLLRELADVAITTDANGDPIIAEGAVLRFENYETGGVWIASDTIDGGSY